VGYYGSIGVPSLYLTAAEVVEKMHHQGITDESYMFDVDLIVIDDITALHQSKSEYERVQLATLLDKRFQDDLGTIVTSNKPLAYWQSDEGHGSIWRTCSAMTEIFIKERHDS
jgi:DNA replication protein DnaC